MLRSLVVAGFLAAAAPALAQKAYVRDDVANSLSRIEEQIRREPSPVRRPAADIRRDAAGLLQRRDPRAAVNLLQAALAAAPRDAALWLDYARATRVLAQVTPNESWRLNQVAIAAAYASYQRATTRPEEATALRLLGEIHASQTMYRLALNAMRASLDINDEPGLRGVYEKLRAEHGFRIVDYKVDSDAASPRVCSTSPSLCSGARWTSRPSSPSPAPPTAPSRRKTSSSAPKVCATASAIPSSCARACRRPSARAC